MIRSRSYTSATSGANAFARPNTALLWTLLALSGAALLLRSFRLGWQPLWWDEGYSIYFATEPLLRMVWLTARDIHPPLYYALLHAWLALLDSAAPEPARLFSILCGLLAIPALAWFAHSLLPARPRVALLAAFLLAINPLHLYYSQEVRMYGLALLLALLATLAFWRLVIKLQGKATAGAVALPWLAYVIGSTLALYTVYYTGFLLAAHHLWAWRRFRRAPRALLWLAGAALATLLLQAPWWSYTLPKLIPYVADKVIADQDTALLPWDYLWRHAVAFTGGHVSAPWRWMEVVRMGGVISLALLPLPWLRRGRSAGEGSTRGEQDAASALATFTLAPLLLGFLVNLRLPFFPDGGERLMLFVLPYLLLWLAWAWSLALERRTTWSWLGLPIILAAVVGLVAFYTVPRYSDHDYRPIIRHVTQHSRASDTVFAIFPWQVGYWRASGARSNGGWLPPQPTPLDQQALEWGPAVEERLSAALAEGTVWFPAPVSFGSRLPDQVEGYLSAHARNLESRWFSPATRLSAWTQQPSPAASPAAALPANFGAVTLMSAAAGPSPVTADNHPLAVDLTWDMLPAEALHATLRLEDAAGHLWARRDYEPLGLFAQSASDSPNSLTDRLALVVPPGLPPGEYRLLLGVGPPSSEVLFSATSADGAEAVLLPLASLAVAAPAQPISPARLPMEVPLEHPWQDEGISLLGHSGAQPQSRRLAGTSLAVTLFARSDQAAPPARRLRVALLDNEGNGVAGWEGWPLPNYPPNAWTEGALVQLPALLDLPATLEDGSYRLVAGLTAPDGGEPPPLADLTIIQVYRRPMSFTRPTPAHPLAEPVQFGAHAHLIGYTISDTMEIENREVENGEGRNGTLLVALDWEVTQTLLPPHHLFVHLTTPDGTLLAQSDGPPVTVEGTAPSGSWLPGEFLRTLTYIELPDDLPAPVESLALRVGLYEPESQVRLPASQGGRPIGDAAVLPLRP